MPPQKKKPATSVIRDWETGNRLRAPLFKDMPLDPDEEKAKKKLKELEKRFKQT